MNLCFMLASLALLVRTNPGADATIACYLRSATGSGTSFCGSSTCYQYSSWGITYGGCGTCASQSNPSGCMECSTNYCNTGASGASSRVCFLRGSSTSSTGNGTFVTCTSSTVCYEAFNSGTNYAGCGSCRTPNSYCRTCYINLCNTREYSGVSSLHGWRVPVTAAAAAAASMLALMMKSF